MVVTVAPRTDDHEYATQVLGIYAVLEDAAQRLDLRFRHVHLAVPCGRVLAWILFVFDVYVSDVVDFVTIFIAFGHMFTFCRHSILTALTFGFCASRCFVHMAGNLTFNDIYIGNVWPNLHAFRDFAMSRNV